MHSRFTYPGHPRLIRNLLIAVGASLVGYRVFRAATLSTADLITSIATAAIVVAAVLASARARILKARAEAEAEKRRADTAEAQVVQMSEVVLDDEADKALWDSIPAAKIDEDTCAFGVNVVAINRFRYPRAG